MFTLSQAIDLLIEHIEQASDEQRRFSIPLSHSSDIEVLDWLDAQPIYPKFFWHSRDGRERVAAIGQLYTFLDPAPAYKILAKDQRVWGGKSFDGRSDKNPRCMSSLFFLPQVELIVSDGNWEIAANFTQDKSRTIQSLRKLISDIIPLGEIHSKIQTLSHLPNKKGWESLVNQALEAIELNEFKKVVLARETHVELTREIRPAELLKASFVNNKNSFHFMLVMDSKHSFIGSTPERLYRREGQTLYTEALAGTIGRSDDEVKDQKLSHWLINDDKNLIENQYVVDDIIDRLDPHSNSIDVDSSAHLVKLRKVQHLRREITAELKAGVNGVQLLATLQPTAAVAGLPRQEAFSFIEKNEPFPRGWYAGSIGYISHDDAQFCVAIRSALVNEKNVKFYAGAGIVKGSQAEHEWQELDKKVSTLLSLVGDEYSMEAAS